MANNCDECHWAIAVDAAVEYGMFPRSTLDRYQRGETPIGHRARAICEETGNFVGWEDSCRSFRQRTDGVKFGMPDEVWRRERAGR